MIYTPITKNISTPTLSHAFAVTPIQLVLVRSSVLAVLPPNLAECLLVGVWDKTRDNAENFSATEGPQFHFCPGDKKQAELQVADILVEGVNSPFQPLFTHFEEGIIASGFIPARFRRSEVACCDHDWKNRCWGLVLNQGAPYFRYSSKKAFSFPNGMMSI